MNRQESQNTEQEGEMLFFFIGNGKEAIQGEYTQDMNMQGGWLKLEGGR